MTNVKERGTNPITEIEFIKDYFNSNYEKIKNNRFFDIKDLLFIKKMLGAYTKQTINKIINCYHITQTCDSSYCYKKDNYVIVLIVNGAGTISLRIDDMKELKSVYSLNISK